jgi:hypothetical protein
MSLLTPSGGLVYHLRALRYRRSLWLPFRRALSEWLDARLPEGKEIVLVGPSAGHCLPLTKLRRASKLVMLEPDPVARRLLALRLRGPALELEARDLLFEPMLSGGAGLDALLERRPHATLLFCNVLGQLHFGVSDADERRFQTEFRRRVWPALQNRAWLSFHDRWSLDQAAGSAGPARLDFERSPSDAELGEAWFGREGAPLAVLDHGTASLFPQHLPRRYLAWQITPGALHIVEAVASR